MVDKLRADRDVFMDALAGDSKTAILSKLTDTSRPSLDDETIGRGKTLIMNELSEHMGLTEYQREMLKKIIAMTGGPLPAPRPSSIAEISARAQEAFLMCGASSKQAVEAFRRFGALGLQSVSRAYRHRPFTWRTTSGKQPRRIKVYFKRPNVVISAHDLAESPDITDAVAYGFSGRCLIVEPKL